GTGFSTPSLFCSEDIQADAEQHLVGLAACRDGWEAKGVDLAQYNTRRNAEDLDLARQALVYDTWNVYGISYGSRLGLTLARDYPDHVRALVIDGVLPLQVDLLANGVASVAASLQLLRESCAAQADCDAAYGDIEAKLLDTVE